MEEDYEKISAKLSRFLLFKKIKRLECECSEHVQVIDFNVHKDSL